MHPRVRIAQGTAYDVVLSAAAVADPVWRDTFEAGPATYEHVRAAAGDELVRQVAPLGRFGWINLVDAMSPDPGPWDLSALIAVVRETAPEDLHLMTIGGTRRQLLAQVDEDGLRRALRGDTDARLVLEHALTSQELVIEVAPWLLDVTSEDVHDRVLQVLETWREVVLRPDPEAALASSLHEYADAAKTVLATSPGHAYLDAAIGGLRYDPAGLDWVVSVSSTQVAPIVVVVDGRERTTIVHPPLVDREAHQDSRARLLELSRAVGDKTRMQLLTILETGEKTAVDLARGMRTPRTTLLHHLAILRSAGLVHVTVTPGGATIYRLRPEGFAELSAAALDFGRGE